MGLSLLRVRVVAGIVFLSLIAMSQQGCQMQPVITPQKLIRHQQVINTTGLRDVASFDVVKARAAAPRAWDQLSVKKTALFTDLQWRSPSKQTAVGVVFIKMPLPLPPATLIWFAKQEYLKRGEEGKILGQWSDELGRQWFEAENKKYHARGYVLTKGFEAWIVYSGYRTENPASADEIAVAKRAQETIFPTPFAPSQAQTPTATAAD
ncbi:MAG TPA: hypothetical protein VF669_03710 [Tepidisphaeraceae bacterium]|jgi:hypothetical protein